MVEFNSLNLCAVRMETMGGARPDQVIYRLYIDIKTYLSINEYIHTFFDR